jgi:LmbE family N-acetylglucosaminyl deacetylase
VLVYDSGTSYWAQGAQWFRPSLYVDVSDQVELKRKALAAYTSQLQCGADGELPSMAQLAFYGERICVAAAEAFEPLRLAL